jgi:hypothetical protein
MKSDDAIESIVNSNSNNTVRYLYNKQDLYRNFTFLLNIEDIRNNIKVFKYP